MEYSNVYLKLYNQAILFQYSNCIGGIINNYQVEDLDKAVSILQLYRWNPGKKVRSNSSFIVSILQLYRWNDVNGQDVDTGLRFNTPIVSVE